MSSEGSGPAAEDRASSIWSILPSFDPSADDPREYVDKVKFLHSICPAKDKAMLAPRLALLMKGTAWAQIKAMDATKLSDPEQGINVLLKAVATWEEAAELQTYDKFEKAIYKVIQRSDETNMSYVNRMNVSFLDLGDAKLADMQAFVLLRQSSLTSDDKRKVITMTGGKLETDKIESAMRSLSTKVLGSGSASDPKKKVYPVNYVEEESEEVHHVADYEEPMDEETILQAMVDGGDEDAQVIADFEDQLVEICQDSPELSLCFSAYAEARGRLRDKIKSRGFWPPKGKGKMNRKGFGGHGGKGGGRRRQSLADRIAASHCRICGQKGHWKWECPRKGSGTTSTTSADVNMALEVQSSSFSEEIVNEIPGSGTVLSLNDLLHGAQDLLLGSCGTHPPFESLEFLKQEPKVNEEFIFMTVAGRNSQTHGCIAQFLNTDKLSERLKGVLCRSGIRTENMAESVLSAEVVCPGIIDTGASKSVIGQRRVKSLIESLPLEIQPKVQWGKSDTVFRFGNNGTLKSVGALFIPFGSKWMRLEVVNGETPFLLSNAFLKATAADVSSRNSELVFHGQNCRVPLKVNSKGLFTVELAQVLAVFSRAAEKQQPESQCEMITLAETKLEHAAACTAAATDDLMVTAAIQEAHQRDPIRSPSNLRCERHGVLQGREFEEFSSTGIDGARRAPFPRGSRAELCKSSSSADPSPDRDHVSSPMGRTGVPGREVCRGELQEGLREGRQVQLLHEEPHAPDQSLGSQLPKLCESNELGKSDACEAGAQGQNDVQACGDLHLASGGILRGLGADGRSIFRDGHTTEEGTQPGSSGLGRDERDQGRGEGATAAHQDCHLAAGARSSEEAKFILGGLTSVAPASTQGESTNMVSTSGDFNVELCQKELDQLSVKIQNNLDAMLALSWEVNAQRGESPSKGQFSSSHMFQESKLDLLEIYCEEDSTLTNMALKMGLKAKRFTKRDGDLSTPEGRAALWKILRTECPRDVWMSPDCKFWGNFSRLNMCRSEAARARILQGRKAEQTHLQLCREVYEFQVLGGRHFHMEQPQGSEAFDQKVLQDVVQGTLRSVFDMCEVGKLRVPQGNNFLRKRSVVRTTSRELHETLDSRYCKQRHNHQPIEGSIRYLGRTINLSEYAARYSNGFSKNICWYLLRSRCSGELPLELSELCLPLMVTQEEMAMAGEVKARRCRLQRKAVESSESASELPHKTPRKSLLREIFKRVEQRAPRAGTVQVGRGEVLFQDAERLCTFDVQAVEICRGTDRFRVPKGAYDEAEIPLRQTFILHRQTGEVEELGKPEKWLDLPRCKRIGLSGTSNTSSSAEPLPVRSDVQPVSLTKRPTDVVDEPSEKRHCPLGTKSSILSKETPSSGVDGNSDSGVGSVDVSRGEYDQGFPPKNVAVHGPRFLELKKEERDWIRRVHHRMGHPDPSRFAKFLKDTHAEPHLVAGALEFQCDSCSETQQGYALSRPAAIHKNLGFNEVVGLDKAVWTNDQGVNFSFFHVLDEGTLFHLGKSCGEDAEAQIRCFDDIWLSWAGPPKQVYLDPATEYTGGQWLSKMQSEDVELKMTATDSHWQLGRVESHGKVIKKMLDRMNAEAPILDSAAFSKALRQAFTAKNTMSRVHGYTPEQAVLGFARRLPASVTSGEGVSSHLMALDEGHDSDQFRKALDLRCSARKAFVEADNCSSLRRALLRRSRPLRDPYEIGDWVLYWKKVGGNMRRERGKWYGPARVAMVEGTKIVWLSHANKLIRASPEQLRPASFREWKAVQSSEESKYPTDEWLKRAQYQDFFDLGDSVPEADDVTQGDALIDLESSLPEPEQAPSSPSDGASLGAADISPAVNPEEPGSSQNDPLTTPIPEALPGELSEGDAALFGDTISGEMGHGCKVWEIDITPEGSWESFGVKGSSQDEICCLVSEMRKKRVEVKLRDLGERDQRLFAAAKHKEIGAWLHHKTVRKVSSGKIPEHALMRCRWILNWKSAAGDEAPDQLSSQGMRAKARLVIIGFEDPGIDSVANDAPTLSKDGRMAVLQTVASNRWELISFDVSTAFLHGRGDGRVLGIHPPPELRESLGMGDHDQCALDGGAYGRIDAPYLWFCEFRDELIRQGCTQCPLDPCVFGLYSKDKAGNPICHGSIGVHVDDGIAGGDSKFLAMLKRVENRFSFGSFERKQFKYTGINFKQWDDYSIEYDQISYIEKVSPITIPKHRRQQPSSAVSETERSELRSLVGALQYAAVHTRPDLSAKVGELQSSVCRATVAELLLANKVLAEAKQHPVSLMVLPIAPNDVTYCAFSDASFLSNKQNHAHQGTLVFATTPELLENRKAVVAPVAWTSKRVPRIVRSTLGAEAAALCNSVDRLMWIRVMWAWMRNPDCNWRQPEKLLLNERTSALVTDCKSAYDLLTRTALPQCSEHRTTIECLLIRERLRENCIARWVSSQAMLADCLTKSMDSQALRQCLATGKYSLRDEDFVLKES
eukprot:s411_g23.t1